MSEFISIDDVDLEVAWHGPRAGTRLVFLHEGLGSVEQWRDFPKRLSEATGLGAFVYGRAGHGRSQPPRRPRGVDYMHLEARRLPEILVAAGIDRSILVGHSDGASIAILAARMNPVGIRGLILEAPHVFTEEMGLASIAAAREAYLKGDLRARMARHHSDVDAAFWGWNGPWLDPAFREWNIEEALSSIVVPMLLIQGLNDEYGTTRQLDAIAEKAGGVVEKHLFDRCGHAPHRDRADDVLATMREFAKSVTGR